MKKTLLFTTLFVLITTLSFAQDNTSYRTTLKKMMQATGSELAYKGMMNQMVTMFKQQQTNIPEEFWNELSIEMNKMAFDQIVDLVLPIYQKHLTEADMKGMIAFYETPLGRKFAEKTPLIAQESMVAGQEWGKKIGETVVSKLKEKGYLNKEN